MTVFLTLRQRYETALLPLMFWGPVALIQEGVTFSLGLLTPGGDAQWVASLGIPEILILLGGITLLALGIGIISQLLRLTGIEESASFGKKYAIVVTGMCSLMLLRFTHSSLTSSQSILENFIPLVFSLLLGLIVACVNQFMIRPRITKLSTKSAIVSWPAVLLSVVLGLSMFTFQIIF